MISDMLTNTELAYCNVVTCTDSALPFRKSVSVNINTRCYAVRTPESLVSYHITRCL